jgi:hypothetical protein
MLALKRQIGAIEAMRTPMLVPSFSSKAGPVHGRVEVDQLGEIMTQPLLVSAYDLFYKLVDLPSFATAIFVDSGGYEANKDAESVRYGDTRPIEERPWTEDKYQTVLRELPERVPYVAVSFDHPNQQLELPDQVTRANELFPERGDLIREFLIKPEPTERFIDCKTLVRHVELLASFPIIGLTDKELGGTMMERLACVGRLRGALSAIGATTPVHIFGSLDPLTAPLYFLAGADVFDGLAWLRYGFSEGRAIYPQNFEAVELNLHQRADSARAAMWHRNSYYLIRLEDEMKSFLKEQDFEVFGANSAVLRKAWSNLAEELGA